MLRHTQRNSLLVAAVLLSQLVWSIPPVVHAADSSGTTPDGLAFLAENRDKPGVVELPSGLQYKILESGTGVAHPAIGTACSCHYRGTLIDGTTFDASYDRGEPTTFAPNQVIKGWTEAMQLMVAGDKWELYIPSELAYGDRGSPPKIAGGAVLIFTLELLEIVGDEVVPALRCKVDNTENCNEQEKAYIDKVRTWDATKPTTELQRLERIVQQNKNMMTKPDLMQWIQRRMHVLRQLVAVNDDAASSSSSTTNANEL